MKIVENIKLANLRKTAVAMGVFDAVHVGHLEIIKHLKKIGKRKGLKTVLLTFDPYPGEVFLEKGRTERLLSKNERLKIFKRLNIDTVVFIKFSKRFSALEAEKFVRDYLVKKLDVKHLIVGDDFTLGKNRKGDTKNLKQLGKRFGFYVTAVTSLKKGRGTIKSTKIRGLIKAGKVRKASLLLGRLYTLDGRILKGRGEGKKLTYRTANIEIPKKPIPADGIYATLSRVGKRFYRSVTYIGKRPTFSNLNRAVETYIFGFNKNVYGKKLKIAFIERIRNDKKFENKELLKEQISRDISKAALIHRRVSRYKNVIDKL